MDRIVLLVDMDCFYVQVEQKHAPEYQNRPCVVVQYKNFKGGGIIAVNYEARAFGIKRGGMHGDDAKRLCPDVHIFQIAEVRGKADLTKYRDASVEIIEVLKQFSSVVEKASVDEAYLDITKEIDKWLEDAGEHSIQTLSEKDLPGTFVEGLISDHDPTGVKTWLSSSFAWSRSTKRLALAAILAERIRLAVLDKTGYKCSAGIAWNKMLAKLACGMHKPNRQTLLLPEAVKDVFANVPILKVRNLGGHLGSEVASKFQINTMGELSAIPKKNLLASFGEKHAQKIFDMAQGIDHEQVVSRQVVKSIGCGKNFRGPDILNTRSKIEYWLRQMAEELEERLVRDKDQNNRSAELLTVGILYVGDQAKETKHKTRCCRIATYDAKQIALDAFKTMGKLGQESDTGSWSPAIINLSLSASKFRDNTELKTNASIKTLFEIGKPSVLNEHPEESAEVSVVTPKSQAKSILIKPSSVKKRPSSSVSFSSRSKQPKLSLNDSTTDEHCEVSWADDAKLAESDKVFVSPPLEIGYSERANESSEDDSLDDHASFTQQRQQKDFEKVSQSIRSLISNALAQTIQEEQLPQSESTPQSSNVSGGFFKRKKLELQQTTSKSPSLLEKTEVIDLEGEYGSTSEVIDLDKPSSSRNEGTVAARQNPYYVSVEAGDIDLDLLKQMPVHVRKEYVTALGIDPKLLQLASDPSSANSVPAPKRVDLNVNAKKDYGDIDLNLLKQMPVDVRQEYAMALGIDPKLLQLASDPTSASNVAATKKATTVNTVKTTKKVNTKKSSGKDKSKGKTEKPSITIDNFFR